jgi:hypothetical protein
MMYLSNETRTLLHLSFVVASACLCVSCGSSSSAENHFDQQIKARNIHPLTRYQLYYWSAEEKSDLASIRPLVNLFPEFFVSAQGFADILPGFAAPISAKTRLSERRRLASVLKNSEEEGTSTTLLVDITPASERLNLTPVGLHEDMLYTSPECSVLAVKDERRVAAMHVWIRYRPYVDLRDKALYSCFVHSFAFSYNLNPETTDDLFGNSVERIPDQSTNCLLFSENGLGPNSIVMVDDGRRCRTPNTHFSSMAQILAANSVLPKCGLPGDILCQSYFGKLRVNKQAEAYGKALDTRWPK